MILSVYDNQTELLKAIMQLYCRQGFELDPCFNAGNFYLHGIPMPKYCFDIKPQNLFTQKGDCKDLPFAAGAISSIIFDPPFLSGGGKGGMMHDKYTTFASYQELSFFYRDSLIEFYRILKQKGILVFKCMDFINGRVQNFSHCEIYNMAHPLGYYARDLFILTNKKRAKPHNMVEQIHSRKAHTYFWIFEKCRKRNRRMI